DRGVAVDAARALDEGAGRGPGVGQQGGRAPGALAVEAAGGGVQVVEQRLAGGDGRDSGALLVLGLPRSGEAGERGDDGRGAEDADDSGPRDPARRVEVSARGGTLGGTERGPAAERAPVRGGGGGGGAVERDTGDRFGVLRLARGPGDRLGRRVGGRGRRVDGCRLGRGRGRGRGRRAVGDRGEGAVERDGGEVG